MNKNDGGSAFPLSGTFEGDKGRPSLFHTNGMSLRDYFAAQAIAAVLAFEDRGLSQDDALPHEVVARNAYLIADAMLAERSKP